MSTYSLIAIFISSAAAISLINHKMFRLHPSTALMSGALVISIILMIIQATTHTTFLQPITQWVVTADIQHLLLNGMLSYLLFAGALQLDIGTVKHYWREIITLAIPGTIINAAALAVITHYLSLLTNMPIPWLASCLFGALIAPTDPVAVLSTFKNLHAPKNLSVIVCGESLFNDGIGIVLFLSCLSLLENNVFSASAASMLFVREAVFGILFGAALGILCEWLLRLVNDEMLPVLITMAVVSGGYALANYLEISGPLAMVVTGLIIRHEVEKGPENKKSRQQLAHFWRITDDLLNAILFSLLGFELLTLHQPWRFLILAIPLALAVMLVRWVVIQLCFNRYAQKHDYSKAFKTILTWSGLRGGLALALVLAIPHTVASRPLLIAITYFIVCCSVILQSTRISPILKANPSLKHIP